MGWTATVWATGIAAGGVAVGLAGAWARRRRPLSRVAFPPWDLLMLTSMIALLAFGAHLLALAGGA